eukprot:4493757-Pleurochrysis_carterae.AAC.3
MRRARPMHECGVTPAPPISLELSMTTTLCAIPSNRDISRMIVVFPDPGGPSKSTDLSLPKSTSAIMSAAPSTERPMRIVTPPMSSPPPSLPPQPSPPPPPLPRA